MDMNDVIISLGGVERITEPMGIDATDEELKVHLLNNVVGENIPTVAQVREQVAILSEVKVVKTFAHLSPVQIRLALDQLNLLSKWEVYVATGSKKLQIEWEFRLLFERDNATLNAEAKKVGWTDDLLDNIFVIGATL